MLLLDWRGDIKLDSNAHGTDIQLFELNEKNMIIAYATKDLVVANYDLSGSLPVKSWEVYTKVQASPGDDDTFVYVLLMDSALFDSNLPFYTISVKRATELEEIYYITIYFEVPNLPKVEKSQFLISKSQTSTPP